MANCRMHTYYHSDCANCRLAQRNISQTPDSFLHESDDNDSSFGTNLATTLAVDTLLEDVSNTDTSSSFDQPSYTPDSTTDTSSDFSGGMGGDSGGAGAGGDW